MLLGVIGILGFLVFIVLALVSLVKKDGKGKRNILISVSCFVLFIIGVGMSDSSAPAETAATDGETAEAEEQANETSEEEPDAEVKEKEKKEPQEPSTIQEIKRHIVVDMSVDEYQEAKEKLVVEHPKSISVGNGNVGYVLKAKDGYFVANTDGVHIIDISTHASMEEVNTYEQDMLAKAKQAKKENAQTIDFKQLEKNPDRYSGEYVKYTGQVYQIMESDGTTIIRLAVTEESYGYSSADIIYVEYPDYTEFVEDDIVTVYGEVYGSYTYTSQAGYNITLPAVIAEEIE